MSVMEEACPIAVRAHCMGKEEPATVSLKLGVGWKHIRLDDIRRGSKLGDSEPLLPNLACGSQYLARCQHNLFTIFT